MFQRAMEVILMKVEWQFAPDDLDDIVILSKTPKEHVKHVRQVLTLLHDAGVTVNPKKRVFFTNRI